MTLENTNFSLQSYWGRLYALFKINAVEIQASHEIWYNAQTDRYTTIPKLVPRLLLVANRQHGDEIAAVVAV